MKRIITLMALGMLLCGSAYLFSATTFYWDGPAASGTLCYKNLSISNDVMPVAFSNVTVYGTLTAGSLVTNGVTYLGVTTEASITNTGVLYNKGAVTFGSTLTVTNTVILDAQTNSTVFIGLPATVQAAGILWSSNGYVRCGP